MKSSPSFPPVSTRRSFALAFGLAGRDVLHSILIPLLLRAPWIFAQAMLPPGEETNQPELVSLLSTIALFGDFLSVLIVAAMLRQRARSVFGRPGGAPASATSCYAQGLARVPWLFITELARTILIIIGGLFFLFPAFFVSFRLAVATEAVTLDQRDMPSAFRRSFNVMAGRIGEWIPMVVISLGIIIALAFFTGIFVATMMILIPEFTMTTGIAIGQLAVAALFPVIQYAWTFFYLQIVEQVEKGEAAKLFEQPPALAPPSFAPPPVSPPPPVEPPPAIAPPSFAPPPAPVVPPPPPMAPPPVVAPPPVAPPPAVAPPALEPPPSKKNSDDIS